MISSSCALVGVVSAEGIDDAASASVDEASKDEEISVDIDNLPEKEEGTNRFFFYLPTLWAENNPYTETAGIYWWEGTDRCTSWPGYEAKPTGFENVYYYDVPADVTNIVWNNFVDGGIDDSQEIYAFARQTKTLNCEFYDPGESDFYPNGTESYDNMIYVIDFDKTEINEFSGKDIFCGEWFYYYGNGEYGLAKDKESAKTVYTGDSIDLSQIAPEEEATIPTEPTENTVPSELPVPTTPEAIDPDTAERPENTYRYYFYIPKDWTINNPYSVSAGIYWWEGTDRCSSWPGYQAKFTGDEGIYYYDVPTDVTSIIWNNFVNGGTDPEAEIYNFAYKSGNVGSEYYDPLESRFYPEGTDNFDNMIYIVDLENIDYNAFVSGGIIPGLWFYYYGDGEYGLAENKADAKIVYTADTLNLDEVYDAEFGEHTLPTVPSEPTETTEPTTATDPTETTEPTEESSSTDPTTAPVEKFELGDVNRDGKLNIRDATIIQKHLAKMVTLDEGALALADFYLNGKVNIKDATTIQKKIAGLI